MSTLVAQHFGDGHGLQFALVHQARVVLADHQTQPCEQRHHVGGKGHEERVAPAPAQEIVGGQLRMQVGEQPGCGDEAQRRAQLADHRVPAAAPWRGRHRQQRRQTIPRTAERQALAQAQRQHGHDRQLAGRCIGRHERHAHRATAQYEQCQRQFRTTAPAPLDGHAQRSANGAGDESRRQQAKRRQGALQRRKKREEQRRKNQHAGDAEYEEIEVFGRTPDDHANGDVARADFFVGIRAGKRAFQLGKAAGVLGGGGVTAHLLSPGACVTPGHSAVITKAHGVKTVHQNTPIAAMAFTVTRISR